MNLELFISLLNLVLTSCHAPISLFPKLVSIQPYPSQTTKEIALYLLVIIATSSSKMLFYVKYSNFDLKMSICPLTIVIFEPKAVLFILFPTHFHNQIFVIPHFKAFLPQWGKSSRKMLIVKNFLESSPSICGRSIAIVVSSHYNYKL